MLVELSKTKVTLVAAGLAGSKAGFPLGAGPGQVPPPLLAFLSSAFPFFAASAARARCPNIGCLDRKGKAVNAARVILKKERRSRFLFSIAFSWSPDNTGG